MSILDRDSLQASSLADLHAIASELSIDSFRRLRKAELIDAILERQSGAAPTAGEGEAEDVPEAVPEAVLEAEELAEAVQEEVRARDEDDTSGPTRRRRSRRSGRGRGA